MPTLPTRGMLLNLPRELNSGARMVGMDAQGGVSNVNKPAEMECGGNGEGPNNDICSRRAFVHYGLASLGSGALGVFGVRSAINEREAPQITMVEHRPSGLEDIAHFSQKLLDATAELGVLDDHVEFWYHPALKLLNDKWKKLQEPALDLDQLNRANFDLQPTVSTLKRRACAAGAVMLAALLVFYDIRRNFPLKKMQDAGAEQSFTRRGCFKAAMGIGMAAGVGSFDWYEKKEAMRFEREFRKKIAQTPLIKIKKGSAFASFFDDLEPDDIIKYVSKLIGHAEWTLVYERSLTSKCKKAEKVLFWAKRYIRFLESYFKPGIPKDWDYAFKCVQATELMRGGLIDLSKHHVGRVSPVIPFLGAGTVLLTALILRFVEGRR